MKTKLASCHNSLFLIIVFVLGVMNLYGTKYFSLSLIAALVEYAIVITLLVNGNYAKSYIYYLAFIAITLDSDLFIYGDAVTRDSRYTFNSLPVVKGYLRWIIACCYWIFAHNEFKNKGCKLSSTLLKLKKWMVLLFVTGLISVVIGMLFNDNGIMNRLDIYPKTAIIFCISFGVKLSLIITAIYLSYRVGWLRECSDYVQLIIIAVSFTAVFGALLGFKGLYADEGILLSTHAIGLSPMLLLFAFKKNETHHRLLSLLAAVSVIVFSFLYGGTMIGSKWYLIIAATLFGLVIFAFRIKSFGLMALILVAALVFVPFVFEPIQVLFGGNSFVDFKLEQALKVVNIFGAKNVAEWYGEMGNSPLQRFDELHNTLIEYMHKPWFALFGKGLGGTTLHYTALLSWSGLSDYTIDQIQMKAFYRMHESLAVLFLQHGIVGLLFFLKICLELIKRFYLTPWAMIGFIWFFFYWDYGSSLFIGCIAMVLALCKSPYTYKSYKSIFSK